MPQARLHQTYWFRLRRLRESIATLIVGPATYPDALLQALAIVFGMALFIALFDFRKSYQVVMVLIGNDCAQCDGMAGNRGRRGGDGQRRADRAAFARMDACLIPVVIVGGLVGGSQFTETGEFAMTGLFGSKNNFALHISEMFFVCCAVLANARQA